MVENPQHTFGCNYVNNDTHSLSHNSHMSEHTNVDSVQFTLPKGVIITMSSVNKSINPVQW